MTPITAALVSLSAAGFASAAILFRLARRRPGEARRGRDTHPYGHAPGTIHPDPLVTHWRNPRC